MQVIPAIDLRNGRCVRLEQGKKDKETVFGDDPVAVARRWQEEGAAWLHVVDLDGAFAGEPRHLTLVEQIVREVSIPVQLGGGIRSLASIRKALKTGAARVILGTVAVEQPGLVRDACAQFGEQIMVSIDARDGAVTIKGWETATKKDTVELAKEMKKLGVTRVVFTDTTRDGTLQGPNYASTGEVAVQSGLKVIASGGISSLADIIRLRKLVNRGVEGVIVGKALYTGVVSLREAVDAVKLKGV